MLKLPKVMVETVPQKPKRKVPWVLGLVVLALLFFLVLLQSSNLWKTFSAETASDTLLLYALSSLNFVAFVVFGFIFLRSIAKLLRERREFQIGARIKTRLLGYFAIVSLLPILAMAGFSYLYMNRALERWFTQIPENVVREAREVQSQSIADRTSRLDDAAKMIAALIERSQPSESDLAKIADAGKLAHIEVLAKDNRTIAVFDRDVGPEQRVELDSVVNLIRTDKLSERELKDGIGFDAAVVPMAGDRKLMIVPDPYSGQNVGQIVENSLLEFDRLKDKQANVRWVGLLTLGVLTFLLIFASSWIAFYIARGLTVPIKALAEGADEIARGNLGFHVDAFAEDELALLVSAFNEMSARLQANSTELTQRQRYIETVVATLPNGVISFDQRGLVGTINPAALNILRLEVADFAGVEIDKIVRDENLPVLERLLSRAKRVGHASEQTILKRSLADGSTEVSSDLPVVLTAAALPDDNGVVLVIEDLSELISAQRASAWQEVARRMAHEIKNPLTPIQLSAERIAKKCVETPLVANTDVGIHTSVGPEQARRIVKEGTDTILREVESLKAMVDEFSRFARLPNANLETCGINDIVRRSLSMYQDRLADLAIIADLSEDLPDVSADAEQLKRVFVNLIQNAIEAFPADSEDRQINISTRYEIARDLVVVEVADNGAGILPSDLQKLFQPYFSTKGRGTGLGLAIVQRIIGEHQGKIKVAANHPRGAKFIIELPTIG
ncbi:MAG: HAMP domain-containing protein [Pyrinomonadaceae bacterium]|nr:HAMP domain-containing protein [Pyrinomonadaceae bacterium]